MRTIKSNVNAIIFGKGAEGLYKNFTKYLQRKWGFTDIYISNAFIILLSHVILDKKLTEIIDELLRYKNDKKSRNIKRNLPYRGFKNKIKILEGLGFFKDKKRIKERLCSFNTTRNAFGHLYPAGHKAYEEFLRSYDLSKKILTIGRYNKIAKLQDILEYILNKIKNN